MGQITAVSSTASALVEVFINVGVFQNVLHDCVSLVLGGRKVERESTSGEVRRHYGSDLPSAANACDRGTCKSWQFCEQLVHVWFLERWKGS